MKLALISGAILLATLNPIFVLASYDGPQLVEPYKAPQVQCRVTVNFKKEGTVTGGFTNKDFDSVSIDSSRMTFNVEPEPGRDGVQMFVDRRSYAATVIMFDMDRNEVGRGGGQCF